MRPSIFTTKKKTSGRQSTTPLSVKDGKRVAKFGKYTAELGNADEKQGICVKGDKVNVAWSFLGKSAVKAAAFAAEKAAKMNVTESIECVTGQSKASRAVYEDAEKGVDIEYVLSGNNVKENIIVKEKAEEYRYTFMLDTAGLTLNFRKIILA